MNILVVGANGQLGMKIREVSMACKDNFIFTDVDTSRFSDTKYLDATCLDSVLDMVESNNIGCVINCAAYTDVEKAEGDLYNASKLNIVIPRNLAYAMERVEGLLVHISTDYVFGNNVKNTPYNECDEPSPCCAYGTTKLIGEEMVLTSNCYHYIIRTSWLYSEDGNNFVRKIMDKVYDGGDIKVVNDQIGSPTYAGDLAEVIMRMINNYKDSRTLVNNNESYSTSELASPGIYSYCNEGLCSWYDFAYTIASYIKGADDKNCIIPCRSNEFPSKARRPSYSVLDTTKIKNALGIKIPDWRYSLRRCVNNMIVCDCEQAD